MHTPCKSEQQNRPHSRHARAFQQVLREGFGVAFLCYDAATGASLDPEEEVPGDVWLDAQTVVELATAGKAVVMPGGDGQFRIVVILHAAAKPILVAVGSVSALAESAGSRALEQARLQTWARDFSERLRLADLLSARARVEEDLRGQLNLAWQVNMTLGDCMSRLRFTKPECRNRQRILEAARKLLDAEALLWVPAHAKSILAVGQTGITAGNAARLGEYLIQEPAARGPEPVFCNDPRGTFWGGAFPEIHNLMALSFGQKASITWVIAVNKTGKATSRSGETGAARLPFSRSDAALLSPFVSMLEMQFRTAASFDELRSLMVGLARSLTAAIDAKDAYTAGHSERVARLASEIGRELGLPQEQLSDVFLAGLLHDIGKIGIREAVLCKPERLTAEEFDHMKQHVTIGYHILQDLHQLSHVLPGVLYHHEQYDGKGYPEGRAGNEIPFLARLLAVADGFDAMNSSRPYRRALTQVQVFAELEKGAGTQWDPQIVAAARSCKQRLVAISHHGLGESLCQAVYGALRTDDGSTIGRVLAPSGLEDIRPE